MIDIVFPKNNENEFIDIALQLKEKKIIFIYDKTNPFTSDRIKVETGTLFSSKSHNSGLILADATHMTRKALESVKANVVYNLEKMNDTDAMHYRRSGLDQVLAKALAKRDVILGFNFNEVLNAPDREKIIARMSQNIKIGQKFGVKMIVASFTDTPMNMRSLSDMTAFMQVLGLKVKMTRLA